MERLRPKTVILVITLLGLITTIEASLEPIMSALPNQELNALINTVQESRFRALQTVSRYLQGSISEDGLILRAAAWGIAPMHPNLERSQFDTVYRTHYEERCSEILPVYNKYKINYITENIPMRPRVELINNIATTCKELMNDGMKMRIRKRLFDRYVLPTSTKYGTDRRFDWPRTSINVIALPLYQSTGLNIDHRCII